MNTEAGISFRSVFIAVNQNTGSLRVNKLQSLYDETMHWRTLIYETSLKFDNSNLEKINEKISFNDHRVAWSNFARLQSCFTLFNIFHVKVCEAHFAEQALYLGA